MSVTYTFPPVSSPCCAEFNPFQPYFRRNCIPFAVAAFFRYQFSGFSAFVLSTLCPFVPLSLSPRAAFHFPFFAPISLPPDFSRLGFFQCTMCSATSRSILPHSLLSHHPAVPCALHPAAPTGASTLLLVILCFLPPHLPTFAATSTCRQKAGHKKGVSLSGNTFF